MAKPIHLSVRADDILWLNALYDAHCADEEGGSQHPEHQDEQANDPGDHEDHAQVLQVVVVPDVLDGVAEQLVLKWKTKVGTV